MACVGFLSGAGMWQSGDCRAMAGWGKGSRMRRILVLVVVGTLLLVAFQTAALAADVDRQRLAGADRFATAAAISQAAFPDGAETALLARADVFADALAAGALAGSLEAPVLLARSADVPEATLAALEDLGVSEVTILGGTQAIDPAVEQQLRAAGLAVDRVAGATRYATAAEIARRVGAEEIGSVDGQRTALLASGVNFPDALAAGALSYAARLPILLTPPDGLAADTAAAIDELGIEQVLVLGGPAAIEEATEAELAVDSVRLAGADRTRTAAAVADFAVTALGFTDTEIVLARGDAFPDALASAPYAGKVGGPLLLIPTPTVLGGGARDYLAAAGETVERLTALGGPAAVSNEVLDEAEAVVRGEPLVDERLLFSRVQQRDTAPFGVWDVYLREVDGTVRRVTDAAAEPDASDFTSYGFVNPSWAPNGAQFAATKRKNGTLNVVALGMDGTERWKVEDAHSPAWSPDGALVAFIRMADPGGVWTVRADGSGLAQRVDGEIESVSWSPDSTQFAYVDASVGSVEISNRDGSGRRVILQQPAPEYARRVTWSPDGVDLAVTIGIGRDPWEIGLIRADGQGEWRTLVAHIVHSPVNWRADGQVLVFGVTEDSHFGDAGVYRINRDGTGLTRLFDGHTPAYRWPDS